MLLNFCIQILAVAAAAATASTKLERGGRIYGGTNATKDDYPPVVSYSEWEHFATWKTLAHICGGTIIHPQWVLTAAHCPQNEHHIPLSKIRIRAGFTDLTDGKPLEPGEFDYEVEKWIIHPESTGDILPNDVALVKIKGDFGDRQVAVFDDSGADFKGEATAFGWGRTEKSPSFPSKFLMKVTEPLCQIELDSEKFPPELAKKQLICFGSSKGRGACRGDSGGPLVFGPDKIFIGLTSFGNQTACGRTPTYYQRVSYHIPWIEETIGAKVKVRGATAGSVGVFGPTVSFLAASAMSLVKLLT